MNAAQSLAEAADVPHITSAPRLSPSEAYTPAPVTMNIPSLQFTAPSNAQTPEHESYRDLDPNYDIFTPNFLQNFNFTGLENFPRMAGQAWSGPIDDSSAPDTAGDTVMSGGGGGGWTAVNGPTPGVSLFDSSGRLTIQQDLARSLAEAFFEKIHPLIPCLHRSRFLNVLETPNQVANANPLTLAVLALGCCEYEDKTVQTYAIPLYKRAKVMIDAASAEGKFSVRNLQASTLLLAFLYFHGRMSELYFFLGATYRMACSLGLHRMDCKRQGYPGFAPPAASELEREERRRIMWLLFTFDRLFTFSCGWPFAIDDRFFMVNLPQEETLFQSSNLSVYPSQDRHFTNDLTRLAARPSSTVQSTQFFIHRSFVLLGKIADHFNHTEASGSPADFQKLSTALASTRLVIPTKFSTNALGSRIDDRGIFQLDLILYACSILLYHPTEAQPSNSKLKSNLSQSFNQCFAAVENILSLIKRMANIDQSVLFNPLNCPVYFLCARILSVRYLEGNKRDDDIRSNIDLFLFLFDRIAEKYANLADKYRTLIRFDLERTPRAPPPPPPQVVAALKSSPITASGARSDDEMFD